jgi:hypothetical protein
MTPEEAGKVSEYLPRLDDLTTLAPGTTWFCICTPRRFFKWAFPLIGRNYWYSVTVPEKTARRVDGPAEKELISLAIQEGNRDAIRGMLAYRTQARALRAALQLVVRLHESDYDGQELAEVARKALRANIET